MIDNLRFAIVVSRFNEKITSRMLVRGLAGFKEQGISEKNIQVAHVPGAFEIPIVAKCFAESGKVDAVLCLGAVIRGETYHFELVADNCTAGLLDVSLKTNVPLIFSVISSEDEKQAEARIENAFDGAKSAVEMATLVKKIRCV